jgi:hypothetical protein
VDALSVVASLDALLHFLFLEHPFADGVIIVGDLAMALGLFLIRLQLVRNMSSLTMFAVR